jgi:hypothetical protein
MTRTPSPRIKAEAQTLMMTKKKQLTRISLVLRKVWLVQMIHIFCGVLISDPAARAAHRKIMPC